MTGVALLKARILCIIIVVGTLLGLDLGGSGSCSILFRWHIFLVSDRTDPSPRAVPLFVFYVDQIGGGCQLLLVPEETEV